MNANTAAGILLTIYLTAVLTCFIMVPVVGAALAAFGLICFILYLCDCVLYGTGEGIDD